MIIEQIKLILKSLREYKKYAIITPFCMVLEALMECILPFFMSALIDSVNDAVTITPTHPVSDLTTFTDIFKVIPYRNETLGVTINVTIFGIIMVLLGMCILSITAGILGGRFGAKASVGLGTNLRNDIYKKIQTFSFSNIDKFSTSSLVTRTTTDVANIQMGFQMLIRIVIRAPLMMIFSAIMAFICGGLLAFIFVVLLPITGFGLYIIIKKAMKIFIGVFKRYDALNESVQENVSAIRVVKSYVREDFEKTKFNDASNSMKVDFVKAEKIVAMNLPLINTAMHLSNILVIGLGSFAIYKSAGNPKFAVQLTIGQMSSLLTYGIQILMSILIVSMILVMLVMSLECIRRISEVLLEEPSIKNPDNPLYEIRDGSIKFDNVSFKYKEDAEKFALSNANIEINSGDFVGILGSTGSSKTTFVNLISRLYDTTEGKIIVSGNDVRNYDLKTLRDNVAVVLQKNVLFSGTIESNLKWGDLNATEEEMYRALEISQAMDIINATPDKLQRKVEQSGNNFSGGQKQRLCIARAILKKPKIMILDDSTSAVDTKTDKLIRKGLKDDLPQMTKIVISQRISSIQDADKIIIFNDGKIVGVGSHEELMKTSKIYQEVYTTQNRVGGEDNATSKN